MGHTDGTAQVRDAATMQPLGPPLRHEYAILAVAISPDGTRLLTGCVDGTVHAWSARTRRPIGRPLHHQGPVHSVAFSPDGRLRGWRVRADQTCTVPSTHPVRSRVPSGLMATARMAYSCRRGGPSGCIVAASRT